MILGLLLYLVERVLDYKGQLYTDTTVYFTW
jgi:hypothetical protein